MMNSKFKIDITPRTFHFKQPAGTSRGVYTTRTSWFVSLTSPGCPGRNGVGECAPLPDLSCDASPDYALRLRAFCDKLEQEGRIDRAAMRAFPSMLFGLETALLSFERGSADLFGTAFGRGEVGIPTNGLVWMGSFDEMLSRMEQKIGQGFRCIKLKIGAIDFDSEMELLRRIRGRFSVREMQIRLDANCAFRTEDALYKLELLSQYAVHSIEQPIRKGQWQEMARLCKTSPIPIALDEELIGVPRRERLKLVEEIAPAYFVLKPSLHGGFKGCEQWIDLAIMSGAGFWVTSALESNIGLNAIAQWCGTLDCPLPQGLGTGKLFSDNCEIMPVHIVGTALHCDPAAHEPDLLAWLGLGMLSFLGS